MEDSPNQMMDILKINESIKSNIFNISFKDEKIENEYLETEIKMNLKIKIILHLSYLFNFGVKVINGRYRNLLYAMIIQAFFAFFCIISIVAYYFSKNIKLKKFFDHLSAYFSYIYQIIYSIHIYTYPELCDQSHLLKSLYTLTLLSTLEILFSYESSIIFPFVILIINITSYLIIFAKYSQLKENAISLFISGLAIISFIVYKRYIIELNRVNFLQHYIFKKYSYYYNDIINNMNGYQFTMKNKELLKFNENYKIDIINNRNTEKFNIGEKNNSTSLSKKFRYKKPKNSIDAINLENNSIIHGNNKSFDLAFKKSNSLDLKSKKKINISKKENFFYNKNEKSINFLKSLILKKIENKDIINFSDLEISNLYEIYNLIEKYDSFKKDSRDLSMEELNNTRNYDREIKYSHLLKNNLVTNSIFDVNQDSFAIKKFKFLGEFESNIDNNIYEVYFRKLKEYDNIIDFSIYNITKIKEAERVKAKNELKNKFFAKVAHEFKTPINSIIGLINKIKFELESIANNNEKIKTNINQVESLSNYTIFLVHDIIDYSNNNKKIEGFNINNEVINIKELLNFCKGILETLLISKDKDKFIKIEIINDKLIDNQNLLVYSDNFRLKQILLNFISNSVKFTKSGFIKLKTEIKFLDEDLIENQLEASQFYENTKNIMNEENNEYRINDNIKIIQNNHSNKIAYLYISVIDSGMGINESDLKNIFQEDKNFIKKDYNMEGSGLGLSIANYLSNSLNHRLDVKSEVGEGSEFSIILKCNFSDSITHYYNSKLYSEIDPDKLINIKLRIKIVMF